MADLKLTLMRVLPDEPGWLPDALAAQCNLTAKEIDALKHLILARVKREWNDDQGHGCTGCEAFEHDFEANLQHDLGCAWAVLDALHKAIGELP